MPEKPNVISEAFTIFDENVKAFLSDNTKRLKDVELPDVPRQRTPRLIAPPAMPPQGMQ